MKTKDLTPADEAALKRLPDGWFEIHQVSYMVKNPRWRCDRLVARAMLESKVVEIPNEPPCAIGFNCKTIYRKLAP